MDKAKSKRSRLTNRYAPKGRPKRPEQQPCAGFSPAWVLGQRLGALGWSIIETDPSESERNERAVKKLSRKFGETLSELIRIAGRNALLQLPLSTLEICSNPLIAERVPQQASTVTQILKLLAWYKQPIYHNVLDDRGRPLEIQAASPAEAARIIAQMILFSDLPALPLVGALKFFVSEVYASLLKDENRISHLQVLLDKVRTPGFERRAIVDCVREITAILDCPNRTPNYATAIEIALLDAVLAWPLLIYRNPDLNNSENRDRCLSLPIIVDVKFDGREDVNIRMKQSHGESNKKIVRSMLTNQLRQASLVAKQLWLAKNGHNKDSRLEVENSSCSIDLRLAEEICRGTLIDPLWTERSAEAYLVQLLLSRLMRQQCGMTAAISGLIGPQLQERRRVSSSDKELKEFSLLVSDENLINRYVASRQNRHTFIDGDRKARDWALQQVGGGEAKFRYAAASRKFHKLILPTWNRIPHSTRSDVDHLTVNYGWSHSSVADAAQVGGWRQHGYLRCPDIGYLIHSEPELLPPLGNPFVKETRSALLGMQSAVVGLDQDHSMRSIAALLAYLNFDFRFTKKPIAPSLSWELIRAAPDEVGGRFWQIFLKAIGASDLAIKEHFLRDSAEFTVGLITSIMNGGLMAQSLGCNAPPDIVVVFGASHLWSEGLSDVERKEIPLDCWNVFEQLCEQNITPLRKPFNNVIGQSRIIFLDDDLQHQNVKYFKALPGAEPFRDELFERLSIFDNGFNLHLARHACGDFALDIVHLKDLLDEQVQNGALWRHGGLYYLPHGLRRAPPAPTLELAETYKTMSNALMPGIGSDVSGGLGVAECLEAEIVREAQDMQHKSLQILHEVQHEATLAQDEELIKQVLELRRKIRCEQGLLSRFFVTPTWGVMTSINRNPICDSRSDVLMVAESLLTRAQALGNDDPRAYTCCAQAASNAALTALSRGDGTTAARMFEKIGKHYEQGELIASSYAAPADRHDWLMHTLTWRFYTMREYNRMASRYVKKNGVKARFFSKKQIDECDGKLEETFAKDIHCGIFPSVTWHNYKGDFCSDDAKASMYYRQAIYIQPNYLESYLKAFATVDGEEQRAILSGEPSSEFWTSKARRALDWYNNNSQAIVRNPSLPAIAKRRLAEGAERLQKRLRRPA